MRKYTNDTYCCLYYVFIFEQRLPFIRGNIDTRDGEKCHKDQKKIKMILYRDLLYIFELKINVIRLRIKRHTSQS